MFKTTLLNDLAVVDNSKCLHGLTLGKMVTHSVNPSLNPWVIPRKSHT